MKIGYWKKSLHVIMCCDTVLIGTQRVWLIVGLVVAHTLCYCAFPIDHVLCCSWQVRYTGWSKKNGTPVLILR